MNRPHLAFLLNRIPRFFFVVVLIAASALAQEIAPSLLQGMRWRLISEMVSRSMPPLLSAPSLSSTTAPMGNVAESASTSFKFSPMCVAGAEAFNCSSFSMRSEVPGWRCGTVLRAPRDAC